MAERPENLGLVLKEINDLHCGAFLIVVVNLGRVIGIQQAAVDALYVLSDVKNTHPNLPKRCPIVGKGAIANGRTRNRGEPAVKYRKFLGERR